MSKKNVKEALTDLIDIIHSEYGDEIIGFEVNLERPIIVEERNRQGFFDIKEFILKYIVQDKIEL
jgi:uncharacterized protein YjaZ